MSKPNGKQQFAKAIKILLKAADAIAVAFLCAVLAYNLYMVVAKLAFRNDMPKVFGFTNAIILTGSMSGAIEAGDMVIIKEQSAYALLDVITYKDGAEYTTHRIVDITPDGKYITKGDANNTPDEPVELSAVVGKVVCVIPKVGKVISFLRTPWGIILLVATGAALVYLPAFASKITCGRKKNKLMSAQTEESEKD